MTVRKWGAETLVNTNTIDNQQAASVTALQDGGFVVVWQDTDPTADGDLASLKFQRFDATGAKVGIETLVNTTVAGPQSNAAVTVLSDGSFIVSFDAGADVRYRRFAADGTPLDALDQLVPNSTDRSDVAPMDNAGFIITYINSPSGSRDVFAQGYNSLGAIVVGATVSGGPENDLDPQIATLTDDTFVVAWRDATNAQVFAQRIAANGSLSGAVIPVSAVSANANLDDVLALTNGGFLVAWHDTGQPYPDSNAAALRGQIYDAAGALVGSAFTINGLAAGNQNNARLVALPDGGFAAVYDSSPGVRGQFFDATGVRVGAEFIVAATGGSGASLAVLSDGRCVVTWQGTASGVVQVFTQIIDPRDGVVNGTGAADTLYGHDSLNDEINGLGGADTLIGMAGADRMYGGDDGDIYVVDNAGDQAIEFLDQGTDTVHAAVSFVLGANLENLTLTGAGKVNATGNTLANVLTGNAAANILAGGLGKDAMGGNGGADRFDFNAIAESAVGVSRDVITGFSHAQHDRIDLATIDADQRAGHPGNQAFVFIGSQTFAAHAGSSEIRRGPGGIIQINVDADNAPEMEIAVGVTLVGSDFVL